MYHAMSRRGSPEQPAAEIHGRWAEIALESLSMEDRLIQKAATEVRVARYEKVEKLLGVLPMLVKHRLLSFRRSGYA